MKVLEKIQIYKIIVILRGLDRDSAVKTARALYDGGIRLIEVAFDQTQPPQNTADTIRALCADNTELCVGAGTVLSIEQLNAAYEAGAKYIISPNSDISIIHHTKAKGLISIPGAFTPTEIVTCYANGADIIKVFPANSLGTAYFKAVCSPLNYIPLAAVGGVDESNLTDFLAAGAFCVGIGSNVVNKSAVAHGDFEQIRSIAKSYTALVNSNDL